MTTICVEKEVCLNDYLDRLTNDELMEELQRRKTDGSWTAEAVAEIGGFAYEPEPLAIYVDELEAIRDTIKIKGDHAAMDLVKAILDRELGCIL